MAGIVTPIGLTQHLTKVKVTVFQTVVARKKRLVVERRWEIILIKR